MTQPRARIAFLFDPSNRWIFEHLGDLVWLADFTARYDLSVAWKPEQAAGAELLFILGYTKIIPAAMLSSIGLSLVIHESALPQGRGFSPVQWQILEGKNTIPMCLIEATAEVDAGDILATTTIPLRGDELLDEIRAAQADATKRLILSFLSDYPAVKRTPQTGTPSTYRKRNSADDRLDPDQTIRAQFNQLRIAHNEHYPAYFEINGQRYALAITKVNP